VPSDSKSPESSIASRLAAETRMGRESEPDVAQAYDNLVQRLIKSGAGSKAPREGDALPSFTLPDENGRLVRSADFAGHKTLVVSLNRGHWCSYCRIELEGLQSVYDEIVQRGGAIVAITPDRQAYARKLKERCGLAFPVLTDMDNAYAMSLGLAVWVGEEIRALYEQSSLDLAESQGNGSWLIPIPATYVLAPDGRIKASFVNADFRKRMPPEDILKAILE
jgi:peroxiredoxin